MSRFDTWARSRDAREVMAVAAVAFGIAVAGFVFGAVRGWWG